MFSADRIGTEVTEEDLQALKQLLTCDYRNFRGKDNKISFGFTSAIAEVIVERADTLVSKDAKICALNDLSLEMYLTLLKAGYKRENIYIAVGNWTEAKGKAVPDTERNTTLLFHHHVSTSFIEDINIISLEEFLTMTFDLIIANPPYGKIGAQITDTIRKEVKYSHFVNLLPANDYKRNSDKDLFKYAQNMEAINNGFADAAVTTHLCEVVKDANEMTLAEFEISQYIDPQLDKYFRENAKRTHYAIDNPDCGKRPDTWEIGKTFAIGFRDANHHHLPYSKTAATYLWNVDRSIDFMYLVDNYNNPRADRKGTYEVSFYGVKFNTVTEFDNFIAFVYSKQGFKFLSKVMTALNVDSFIALNKFLPKVDWNRAWTVEEILEDYGYTETEIAEVMADLENFKDMERD
jgi:hypothetical protein